MAQIDIQGLFKDVLPNEVVEDKEEGVRAADLVGTLGGMAAYYGPQRERQLRKATGGLLGIDLRTEAEAAREELQQLGRPETDEEHQKYADILDRVRPGSGVQYMMAIGQQKMEERKTDAVTKQAEASMRNVELQETLAPMELGARYRALDNEEEQLRLQGESEENLQAWRETQEAQTARELTAREYSNETDRMIAQYQKDELGSRDRARVAEVTALAQQKRDQAYQARDMSRRFLGMEMLSGSSARIDEAWKRLTGNEDEITLLRTQYDGVRNSMVMDALPPGVASDKDIELAMRGFPESTANPEEIAAFMRGLDKMSMLVAEREDARARFMLENKGLDVGFNEQWEARTNNEEWQRGFAERHDYTFEPRKDEEGNIISGRLTQGQVDQYIADQQATYDASTAALDEARRIDAEEFVSNYNRRAAAVTRSRP